MNLSIENLKRYKDVVWLLAKYGRSDLVKQAGLEGALSDDEDLSEENIKEAGELAEDLEELGGTYIKLGQLLSTRADLLPPAYLKALERLQDDVAPFSYEEVEEIIQNELGVRISRLFAEFDKTPLAAASLGQVHRASLRSGKPVVVKVQRPDIRKQVVMDLNSLEEVAELLDEHTDVGKRYEFHRTLSELRKSLLRELDYRREASNLVTIAENLKEFKNIVVPAPIDDYTTSKVLTMEYIVGKKITELTPLAIIDLDTKPLAEELFHAYLKQILVDGFFHADPHPGNLYITDSKQIALLDMGMTGRIMSGFQDNLLNLLLGVSEGRGEDVAKVAMKMGEEKENFDKSEFMRRIGDLVGSHRGTEFQRVDAGTVVLEITKISAETGFRLPPEFTMIAKAMLNLDRVVYTLDPDFNPNESIKRHATEVISDQVLEDVTPGAVLSNVLEVKEFAENLPSRINNILDVIGNNELKVDVDAIDEHTLMTAFEKIANRITMGLILAALVVAASLMMRIESSLTLFGYPAIALILFLFAALGGIALIINIIWMDKFKDGK